MNRLPLAKRTQIIALLVKGMSMQAISRVTNVSINTVTKLLEEVGTACAAYQDANIRGIKSKRIQCDEIWAFCYCKEKNAAPEHADVLGYGDVYTWTGMDADSELMISYMVGKRDSDYASAFIGDLASHLANRVQLSTDGHKLCLVAVEGAFGADVNYAMLVKHYGPTDTVGQRRYISSESGNAEKCAITGNPDNSDISTSFVERQNLKKNMGMRRATQFTNGYSKKVENLEHAVSLHFMHYNFSCIHTTLRATPAMRAGIADHGWSIEEIAELVPVPLAKKRGGYKPRLISN